MTALQRLRDGEPVEYTNSQYIPAFLFLPQEIMDCEPIEFRRVSRNVQKLLRDPVTIAQVESEAFLLGIVLGYSLLVWPAMGMKCTPESYGQNEPATLLSRTPDYWVTMLEDAGILLDAWEWLQVYRNVDGDFAITHLGDIMPIIKALVPQTMAKYHMTEAIQIARELPCHEDFSHTNSTQKRDFRRKWNHSRARTKVLSLEDLQQEAQEAGKTLQCEPVDLEPAVEDSAVNRATAEQFLGMIDEADAEILRLRYRIRIVGVSVYPQGYAAIAQIKGQMTGVNMIADVGNGTMNILYLINGKPQSGKMFTEKRRLPMYAGSAGGLPAADPT